MTTIYRDELNEALDGLRMACTREEAADAYRRAIKLCSAGSMTYQEFRTRTAAAIADSAWPAEFRRVVEDIDSAVMGRAIVFQTTLFAAVVIVGFVIYSFFLR